MKDCLINEYKYGVLIENIPNNIPRKRLGLIAQDIIRNNTNKPFYSISAYNYTPNPMVFDDSIYFSDIEYKLDPKAFPESVVNFRIDYKEYLRN